MEILPLTKKSKDNYQKVVEKAVEIIGRGGVIVCPTDTVYGFLADAFNKKAIKKVFRIKKRPKTKPLAVFVSSINQAKQLAEINRKQEVILKKFWPGKYTFILKLKKTATRPLSKLVLGKDNTIGLRIPDYQLALDLLRKIKRPLVQTSVNISAQPPLTKIKEVLEKFSSFSSVSRTKAWLPDLIIDAGDLPKSKPSRVIDLTKNKKKILR